MNIIELHNAIIQIVPLKANEKDFLSRLRDAFKTYKKLLNDLDINVKQNLDWDELETRLNQLCNGILRALRRESEGTRHSAYAAIKHQLDGLKRNDEYIIKELAYSTLIKEIPEGKVLYRMRNVKPEERHNLEPKNMFHIPLNKRGLVSTQRYSVPGYPCLYLSESVYGCWEEMGRPDFGTVMTSHLKTTTKFYVLDLRIPSLERWENHLRDCIMFFPLVIATMMQTKSSGDTYKPEYTIPQLLTEWVISHNRDKVKKNPEADGKDKDVEIIGILYTSSQKNNDFDYPEYCNDNYAIPVLRPLASGEYCPRLTEMFILSKPTYYDLEVLKNSVTPNVIFTSNDPKKNNLMASRFGQMEKFIEGYDLMKLPKDRSIKN